MQSRLKETAKSVLIVLLLCSALLLAGKTELFKNFIDVVPFLPGINRILGAEGDRKATGDKPAISTVVLPVYAVVTSKYGDHCGIKYDNTALNALYTRVGGLLGEALSTPAAPVEIGEEEWRNALYSVGIYLDYDNPIPLSAILKNRGSKITSDQSSVKVRRICLAAMQSPNRVYIYYINEANGTYYRALTNINYFVLSSYTAEYIPNDAKFAFELSVNNKAYSATEPYTVLLAATKPLAVNATNPVGLLISREKVMEQFGINSQLGSQLYETEKYSSFAAEHFTIRVNSDGSTQYKVTGNNSGSILKVKSADSVPTDYEMLESARSLVTLTLGSVCGSSTSLQLTGFGFDAEEKVWNVYFDYYVNGIPVRFSTADHAATVKISGGYIVYAALVFRNYTLSTATENVLPERQAAVLVSGGGEPILFYGDEGGASLKPTWTER